MDGFICMDVRFSLLEQVPLSLNIYVPGGNLGEFGYFIFIERQVRLGLLQLFIVNVYEFAPKYKFSNILRIPGSISHLNNNKNRSNNSNLPSRSHSSLNDVIGVYIFFIIKYVTTSTL